MTTPEIVPWTSVTAIDVAAPSSAPFQTKTGPAVSEVVEWISDLVKRGGPREEEFYRLDSFMNQLSRLTPEELEGVRTAFAETLGTTETMQGFAYIKPHGYAGDFEIIDRIYLGRISEDPRLAAWDRYFHAQPAPRAVRNRKAYFHGLINRHRSRGQPLRILNLASGPGRCMAEWLSAHPGAAVRFDCVELDAAAIAHAQELAAGDLDRVTFHRENILRFVPKDRYDLIWAAGICDYFSDALFARFLRRFSAALAPGGELVAGNFSVINPTRAYMEVVGEWRLRHRSPENLVEIARSAGIETERVRVGAEAEGVNLFLHIATPVSPNENSNLLRHAS